MLVVFERRGNFLRLYLVARSRSPDTRLAGRQSSGRSGLLEKVALGCILAEGVCRVESLREFSHHFPHGGLQLNAGA
jgi:hypothetical protein